MYSSTGPSVTPPIRQCARTPEFSATYDPPKYVVLTTASYRLLTQDCYWAMSTDHWQPLQSVCPGFISTTSTSGASFFNCAGVPVSMGKVAKCIGTTLFGCSSLHAYAASRGDMVK